MEMFQTYDEMKRILDFPEQDVENLRALAPIFAKHGAGITDRFYENLARFPETVKQIEGRIDSLKQTHQVWMSELFQGEYGEAYFERRKRIGEAHVRIGLPPQFVEGVMSTIRADGEVAIHAEIQDTAQAIQRSHSLRKILDLDLIVINLAYAEERIEMMCSITGMRRKLIENPIKQGQKRKKKTRASA